MSILAWDNEIILASSQKNVSCFIYEHTDSPLLESLQLCQEIWREDAPSHSDKRHRQSGNCGEVFAAQLYYSSNDTPLDTREARIGTWVNVEDGWTKTNPCGDPRAV